MRVLDFIRRPSGPLAYADLSSPVFVCSKPLDLEQSNERLSHLRKKDRAKVPCGIGQCKKKFRNAEELCTHMLEHAEFRDRSEEAQAKLIDEALLNYE